MNASVLQAGGVRFVLRSVRRRWIPATLLTALLSFLAILLLLVLPEKWTASAYLVIEDGEARVVDIQGVIPHSPVDIEALASEMEILRSPALAQRAAEVVGIERLLPEQEEEAEQTSLPPWLAGARQMAADGLLALRGPRPEPPQPSPVEVAGKRILKNLDIEAIGRSRVIGVHYSDSDPTLARDVTAALAEAYLDRRENRHSSASDKARQRVREEIERMRTQVAMAEHNVERYRADKGLLRGVTGNLLKQGSIGSIHERLSQARANFAESEAHAKRLRELMSNPALSVSLPRVLGEDPAFELLREREAEIRSEIARLSPSYRSDGMMLANLKAQADQIRAEIATELRRAAESADAEARLAAAHMDSLEVLVKSASGELADAHQSEVQLNVLEREAEAARTLLTMLLRREQELAARLTPDVATDAYLLSAVSAPSDPSFPVLLPMSILAVLGSAFLSMGLVVVRDLTDQTLKSAEEIEALVPYRTLGLVPRFERARKGRQIAVDSMARDRFAEAVKTVFVQMAPDDRPEPRSILITSALPSEGKTTMAASMAVMANKLGRRVVLLDLDARRPTLHRLFKQALGPGLLEYMRGEALLAEIVRPINDGLAVVTAGTGDNLGDLLNTDRLRAVIAQLGDNFDHVIIDTPPTLAVAEAVALSPVVDQVVHLVQWGVTRRSTFLAATARYRRLKPDRVGVVLYQVDVRRHSSFGYLDSALYHKSLNRYYLG